MSGKLTTLFAAQDMTQGSPAGNLIRFSVPLLIGNLAQQMYNTADSVIVGIYVGDNALAAVGSASPILNLLLALFVGIATGAGILVSQYFGAKERDHLANVIGNCMTLTLLASIIIMVVGPLVTRPLLTMLNTPASILNWCTDYLNIFFLGIVGFAAYNILSGVLRGLGDSLSALVFLIVATVLNIGLDLWFVAGLHMGVAGVAWATLIAQVISAGLVLIRLITTKECYRLILRDIRFHKHALLETIRIGLPGGIQNAVVSFSNLIVQYNINSFGAAAVAGCSAYTKIDGFAVLPVMSFSMAVTTFTGQNVGARNYERVKKGASTCLKLSLAVTVTLSVLLYAFGGNLLRVFSSDPEVLSYAVNMMHFLVPGYVCLSVAHTYAGVVRGAGISIVPMLALVGNMCVLRIIWLTLAMPVFHSIVVVYLGYTLTWFGSGLTMLIYYYKSHWLERQQLHDQL